MYCWSLAWRTLSMGNEHFIWVWVINKFLWTAGLLKIKQIVFFVGVPLNWGIAWMLYDFSKKFYFSKLVCSPVRQTYKLDNLQCSSKVFLLDISFCMCWIQAHWDLKESITSQNIVESWYIHVNVSESKYGKSFSLLLPSLIENLIFIEARVTSSYCFHFGVHSQPQICPCPLFRGRDKHQNNDDSLPWTSSPKVWLLLIFTTWVPMGLLAIKEMYL